MENKENLKKILSDTYQKILLDDPSDDEGKAFVKDLLDQIKLTIDNMSDENIIKTMDMLHIYSSTMLKVAQANDSIAVEAANLSDSAATNIQNLEEQLVNVNKPTTENNTN